MNRQMDVATLKQELELDAKIERELRETILNSKTDICRDNIINNIKYYIKKNNITVGDFARESFVSRATLNNLFSRRLNVSLKHLLGFCETMHCTLNDIVTDEKK